MKHTDSVCLPAQICDETCSFTGGPPVSQRPAYQNDLFGTHTGILGFVIVCFVILFISIDIVARQMILLGNWDIRLILQIALII